jgi:ATP-dependent helicase/nuclease subunit A
MLVGRRHETLGDLAGINTLLIPSEHSTAEEVIEYEADRIARFIRHAIDAKLTVPRTDKELANGVPQHARPSDFMIVARNKWNMARYAQKLQALGVPHQVTGGSALNQVPELTSLVKCLNALVEPENSVALVAVLRSELFGFSDEVLFAYREAGGRFSYRATLPKGVPKRATDLFADAFARLQRYAKWLNQLPPLPAIERIAADLGLVAQASTVSGGNMQAGIVAKVFEVLRAAQVELPSIADLITYLEELIDQDVEFDGLPARPHDDAAVRIMNLHKVKGLEAPIVVLADATGKSDHDVVLHVDRSASTTKGHLAVYGPKRGKQPRALLARPVGWENWELEEDRFKRAEEHRLLYVAATRAGSQMTIVQREAGGSKNHWQFFAQHMDECDDIDDPGLQVAPAGTTVHVDQVAVNEELDKIPGRWKTAQQATYATAAAKEVSVTPSSLHHFGGSGEHGTEWGTVIHFLLEAVMRNPDANLDSLAKMAVAEQELAPDAAPAALQVIKQVTESAVWLRAFNSLQRLVEVPFVTQFAADQSAAGLPTVLRGVIDLAFEEEDGWVIVDYKTDLVTGDRLQSLTDHYRGQVNTYASVWQSMLGASVKEKGLYFTSSGQYVTL